LSIAELSEEESERILPLFLVCYYVFGRSDEYG